MCETHCAPSSVDCNVHCAPGSVDYEFNVLLTCVVLAIFSVLCEFIVCLAIFL